MNVEFIKLTGKPNAFPMLNVSFEISKCIGVISK